MPEWIYGFWINLNKQAWCWLFCSSSQGADLVFRQRLRCQCGRLSFSRQVLMYIYVYTYSYIYLSIHSTCIDIYISIQVYMSQARECHNVSRLHDTSWRISRMPWCITSSNIENASVDRWRVVTGNLSSCMYPVWLVWSRHNHVSKMYHVLKALMIESWECQCRLLSICHVCSIMSLTSIVTTQSCLAENVQPIQVASAFGVSFSLNLQSQSHSSLFNGTW